MLPVDDEGYVIDTEDCEERETAWRERGTSRPITVVGNPVLHKSARTSPSSVRSCSSWSPTCSPASAPPRAWAWPPTRSVST
ncbi:hypothetical protein LT493_07540 [Streptomyces tricolor]|nr:hypothetical protein [Streptomyces tricolor]